MSFTGTPLKLRRAGTWVTCRSAPGFRYYRLHSLHRQGNANGRTGVQQLKLVTPSTPNGKVSNGTATAISADGASYSPDNAFDYSPSNYWRTASSQGDPAWVQYELASPEQLLAYCIIVPPDTNMAPTTWALQGSEDGITWITLDARASELDWVAGEERWFTPAAAVPPENGDEHFKAGTAWWERTPSVVSDTTQIAIANVGSTPSHLHAALYKPFANARSITLSPPVNPHGPTGSENDSRMRITFGDSLTNNRIFLISTDKRVDMWTINNNALGTQYEQILPTPWGGTTNSVYTFTRNGQNINVTVDGTLAGTINPGTQIFTGATIKAGIAWRDPTKNIPFHYVKLEEQRPPYAHLSFDDVIESLRDLFTGSYSSAFDQPMFAQLKNLHETHGAKFSLYVYYTNNAGWNLGSATSAYAAEFQANAHWLRFGFHGHSAETDYSTVPTNTALQHYEAVRDAIFAFAGAAAYDDVPRTHFYAGTLNTVRAWRDTTNGIRGLLSADDNRLPYYLSTKQRDALIASDDLYDSKEGLYFVRTDMRLENESNPTSELESRWGDFSNYGGQQDLWCIFTHEQHLDAAMWSKLDDVCAWAASKNLRFAFPMDETYNS